jgi:hypothetical protein
MSIPWQQNGPRGAFSGALRLFRNTLRRRLGKHLDSRDFAGKERLIAQNLSLCRLARDCVNDPEPAGLQRAKQCREHGRGLPLGVVE